MAKGQLPQVMLFTGPKGTGKTSTSRILAAMVNDPANHDVVRQNFFAKDIKSAKKLAYQEPDASDSLVKRIQQGSSLVVRELDAASNRGIDDVRQLKEQLALPPSEGEMVVYILDEVHMLTTEAFNALLKVLEEPPPHVIFILATTEHHKIPATVVSRCTVVPFAKATIAELEAALTTVLQQEKVKFEPAGVTQVAEIADGSFRDAIKLLELVSAKHGAITAEAVLAEAGSGVSGAISELVQAIVGRNEIAVVTIFAQLRSNDTDASYFYKQLCGYLHQTLLQALKAAAGQPVVSEKVAHFLLQEFLSLAAHQATPIPFLPLELKCLELIWRAKGKSEAPKTPGPVTVSTPVAVRTVSKAEAAPVALAEESDSVTLLSTMLVSDNLVIPPAGDATRLLEKWQEFLEGVKQHNTSIAAILGSAKVSVGDQGEALIHVFYKFHKDQLQQPKFFRMLQDSVMKVLGEPIAFEFVVAPTPVVEIASPPAGQGTDQVPSAGSSASSIHTTGLGNVLAPQELSALASEVLV